MSTISNGVESVLERLQKTKSFSCSEFELCMIIGGLYLMKDKQEDLYKGMIQNLIDKIVADPIDK